MKQIKTWADAVIRSVERVFLGKRSVIEKLLVAILCRGHVLLEDVPGVGKTILARAVAASLGGKFARIQCTPDLMPADVIGVSIYNPKEGHFHFREGPIHSNILLVDEINRATPRTQSALLEAMGENQISVEGTSRPLPDPFLLLATENPVEFEGTFPLPEAQKDRFLISVKIGYPDRGIEKEILTQQRRLTHPVTDLTAVSDLATLVALQEKVVAQYVDEKVEDYIMDIISGTRTHAKLQLGVSPRGTLALYKCGQALAALRGREYVVPEDVKELAPHVLGKRVIVKSEHLFKGSTPEAIIAEIVDDTAFPELEQ
ncbi:MAG TPA: MoxR family ATPase [Spirochaetia bacterium]|nr:MoxR family ATPase [Spirochaetia bacterium]